MIYYNIIGALMGFVLSSYVIYLCVQEEGGLQGIKHQYMNSTRHEQMGMLFMVMAMAPFGVLGVTTLMTYAWPIALIGLLLHYYLTWEPKDDRPTH